eukprot:TRINITY_DN7295_c0_g1_i1.p1 TRINITY_DN7295_c0_g1~~TRINITY_DN7295_c0_g1_i1.p1  ORF type:complete len:257 (+),score=42.04 TRINITY_DN7295_c0_g1_i1:64-834(+)
MEHYMRIPVVTRCYATLCVATTLLLVFGIVTEFDLYLDFSRVIKEGQVWRLFTNFFFVDRKLGFNFIFHMYFLVRYSSWLEGTFFSTKTAEYIFLYIFMGSLITVLFYVSLRLPVFLRGSLPFLGQALGDAVVYVWARRSPEVHMSLFGILNFTAPYLPFAMTGFSLLMGGNIQNDVFAIIAGHCYYYLEDVLPELNGGVKLLQTPQFMKSIFNKRPAEEQNHHNFENVNNDNNENENNNINANDNIPENQNEHEN